MGNSPGSRGKRSVGWSFWGLARSAIPRQGCNKDAQLLLSVFSNGIHECVP